VRQIRAEATKRQSSCVSARQLVLLTIVCTSLSVPLPGLEVGPGKAYGQQGASSTTLQSGEVTTNTGTSVTVGGRNYPLDPAVSVQDDEGRRRQINEIVPGMQVKFHVKGEHIDVLIMVLAR
jgi:hypothetical protein